MRVVPVPVWCDERVRLRRTPASGSVGMSSVVPVQDLIDDRPRGLDAVLAGEQGAIASERVTKESLVRLFLTWLRVEERELSLVTHELLAGPLDASGDRDEGARRESEA